MSKHGGPDSKIIINLFKLCVNEHITKVKEQNCLKDQGTDKAMIVKKNRWRTWSSQRTTQYLSMRQVDTK